MTPSGENAKNFPCVFWDGVQTGIPYKDSLFVTSRVDIDHQISHTTPQAAPYGFKVLDDTELVSSGDVPVDVTAVLKLSSGGAEASGICNAACGVSESCVGWNLNLATFECSLIGLPGTGNPLAPPSDAHCLVQMI